MEGKGRNRLVFVQLIQQKSIQVSLLGCFFIAHFVFPSENRISFLIPHAFRFAVISLHLFACSSSSRQGGAEGKERKSFSRKPAHRYAVIASLEFIASLDVGEGRKIKDARTDDGYRKFLRLQLRFKVTDKVKVKLCRFGYLLKA